MKGIKEDMVYKFFDNKTRFGVSVNEQLAQQLHKLVIKKFKRGKVCACSKIIFGLLI